MASVFDRRGFRAERDARGPRQDARRRV